MKFIDFFAGIGGFRVGFENAGMKCIGFCERDKFAVKSYRAMYNTEGEWYSDDITKLKSEDIPKADIWCGGSPCQNVSLAGRRSGLHGERSSLFFKFTELLKGKNEEDKPEWVIVENVKGLLSSNKGWDFLEYLSELDKCGYDLQWQIFNSKNFGVPQNRERVYTIGHLRSKGRREILPIAGDNPTTLKQLIGGSQGCRVYDTSGLSVTISSGGGGFGTKTGLYLIDQSTIKSKITDEARCLTARYTAGLVNRKAANSAVLEVTIKSDTKQGYDTAKVGDGITLCYPAQVKRGRVGHQVSNTITTSGQSGVVVLDEDNVRIRRLTPKECFRLQGFSDDLYEKARTVCSDTQLYKQAGNAVTVNVVCAIGKKIMENKN